MNDYDRHDYRRELERIDAKRREELAAYREAIRREPAQPEAVSSNGRWQGRFLFRFFFQLAFWSWLIWWLAGSPTIPIRWLQ